MPETCRASFVLWSHSSLLLIVSRQFLFLLKVLDNFSAEPAFIKEAEELINVLETCSQLPYCFFSCL